MVKQEKRQPCPCGFDDYDHCCGRFIRHQSLPDTPEQLMRSRYTAFVLQDEDYLRYTWHPDHCPATPLFDDNTTTKWLRLSILDTQMYDSHHGQVTFKAFYKVQGRALSLHEISRFTQIPDPELGQLHWVYVDGDIQN